MTKTKQAIADQTKILVGDAGTKVVFPLDKLNWLQKTQITRVAITAKVRPEIKSAAQKKAISENRSLSNVIENSLIEYIKRV
ncbi:MAG TPA: hypothetical protein VFF57_12095 [Hanamia sp.]|nr:hypothetical protein [Hanamia sp.]